MCALIALAQPYYVRYIVTLRKRHRYTPYYGVPVLFYCSYAMMAHHLKSSLATRHLAAAGQGLCSGIGFPGLTALTANSPHVDVCVVCSEEGDLLCCDFCPATHHLTCLEPPMTSLPSVSKPCLRCLLFPRNVYH